MSAYIRKNYLLLIIIVTLTGLFVAAALGMEPQDFIITLLRSLSVGSLTFLVASGFSLIFGLLDVLNLAHGTLFMIGAYIGWTVFVRPDTFVDLLTPFLLLLSGFFLQDIWAAMLSRLTLKGSGLASSKGYRFLPWAGILVAIAVIVIILSRYPIAVWDVESYAESPVSISYLVGQGLFELPESIPFTEISPLLAFGGLILASVLASFSFAMLGKRTIVSPHINWRSYASSAALLLCGLIAYIYNEQLSSALASMNNNWLFLIAILVAVGGGVLLGVLLETTMIRPLYIRPIYQLMLTLGLSAIGIEIVRSIWGRPEFTMPRPALFAGTGEGCPATTLADWWNHHCSTMILFGGRIRIYNEIFVPIVGLLVLVGVWILLQRSRLGMIIRAGVQDREMVEALGINVRRIFTQVFAMGVGLAALGGVLAAPSIGLSNVMGESFLLNALIALAIGGLTSYPGAALGSLLVGLLQQFIIKYGQIGIPIPFSEIVFKPTPPIVPASTILLMVIILLILPNGLLGKKE